MKLSAYLSGRKIAYPRETSRLLNPVRSKDSIPHYHYYMADHAQRTASAARAASAMLQKVPGLPLANDQWSMFPFQIYQCPTDARPAKYQPPNYWRTFRVRNGLVLTVHAKGIQPANTDLVTNYYDLEYRYDPSGNLLSNNFYAASPNATDIEVPNSTAFWYFWVEMATDQASGAVRWGTDPTVSSFTDPGGNTAANWTSTNPWTSFDTQDGMHFLLGWVDTNTLSAQGIALVTQLQVGHINGSGGRICPGG